MGQITLYLPDGLAAKLRREAKRLRISLSAYVTNMATKEVSAKTWPKSFLATYGSGTFPAVHRSEESETRDEL
jgi:hypothetical protein